MLQTTRGIRPSPATQRTRFICRPGSSPSHADSVTPARSAYVCMIGPIVASTSAFIITTCLPYLNASMKTLAPNSTDPVTSMRTSIWSEWHSSIGSSATTPRPARTASSKAAWVSTWTTSSTPE